MSTSCDRPLYLLSIKPVFAKEIFSGVKKFEFRRRARIPRGALVVVYESTPVRAVTGEFTVGTTVIATAEEIIEGLSAGRFPGSGEADIPYVKGCSRVAVLEVVNPRRYKKPIPLRVLREILPGFKPPLSYRRLTRSEYEVLLRYSGGPA